MGNRMIKETIRTSKTVNAMTDFQFRVWVYLITYVDDYGRGSADPELIKGLVFPRRKRLSESDIEKALAELAGMGCISLYDVDGESYFYFPNWGEHQRIQSKKSKYPAPEFGELRKSTVNHGELPPETKPNRNQIEPPLTPHSGGRERKCFVPPTVEQVREYCAERKNGIDAEAFVSFYASKGWMVGKSPMKDWKAAVGTWERKRKEESPQGGMQNDDRFYV